MLFTGYAAGTEAAYLELVLRGCKLMLTGNGSDELLELLGMNVYESTAICAVKVVMVWFERTRKLVALLPAKGDDFGNIEADKKVEGAINTDTVDAWTCRYDIADH